VQCFSWEWASRKTSKWYLLMRMTSAIIVKEESDISQRYWGLFRRSAELSEVDTEIRGEGSTGDFSFCFGRAIHFFPFIVGNSTSRPGPFAASGSRSHVVRHSIRTLEQSPRRLGQDGAAEVPTAGYSSHFDRSS